MDSEPPPSPMAALVDAAAAAAAAGPDPTHVPLVRAVRYAASLLGHVPTLVWLAAGAFGWFCYQLYVHQDSLLYHPSIAIPGRAAPLKRVDDNPPPYTSPADWGLQHDSLMLTAADGVRIHAWFVHAPPPTAKSDAPSAPTVVFFHANAGNMGLRLPNVKLLVDSLQANVLIFDYRGYGNSEGSPSERGLELDADAVMDHLAGRTDIDRAKVVFFGRSLGGAVAIRTAVNRPTEVAVLVLENTFTSISDMVDHVMPLVAKARWGGEPAE